MYVYMYIYKTKLQIRKTKFEKFEPNKLIYRNFKQLDLNWRTQAAFENNFVYILDKHAPKNIKVLRENLKKHFNKNLRKQMMTRSRLKNKADKSKNPSEIVKFKQQQNLLANLNK